MAASSRLFNSFFSASVSYRGLHGTIIDPHVRMRSVNTCSEAQRTQVTNTGDFSCPAERKLISSVLLLVGVFVFTVKILDV